MFNIIDNIYPSKVLIILINEIKYKTFVDTIFE